jgi:hypothetical protein
MDMTTDEFAKFRKALFDRLEARKDRPGPLTWEEFKRHFSIAVAQTINFRKVTPTVNPPPFCDCGQPFSTYKMYKDEFGEDFPGCSRCGLRLQL